MQVDRQRVDEVNVPASAKKVERIVIYRMGSLGDTVVALPCFHKIAEAFPDAERYVLTNIPVSSKAAALDLILGRSGLIKGVIDYPMKLRAATQMWALSRRLRRLQATTLVYLTPFRGVWPLYRDLIFFRISGFKKIIGAPMTKDTRFRRIEARTGFEEYECSRLARTLTELGPIDLDNRDNWEMRLTDAEKAGGEQALSPFGQGPFMAINMGGKVVENHWGQDNWRQLFHTLATTHGGYGLFFLGAADEAQAVADIADGWPGPIVNGCGKLMPRESAAALRRASLFIGHDSGPLHLAAAVGVACVAPFSGYNQPRKWHPYGPNHKIVHRMDGIANVKVDEIAAHVRDALSPLPASSRSDVRA